MHAAQNVIVVCKKYYLEVVLKEIDATATYECVMEDSGGIVDRHVRFFRNHHIEVPSQHKCLPLFYWLPKQCVSEREGSERERILPGTDALMKNLIKTNLMLAKKISNTMRYIDDLLTLNNTSFHSAIDDIYPEELKLKKNIRVIYRTETYK